MNEKNKRFQSPVHSLSRSQRGLAEELGVSQGTIQYWGKRGAPLDQGPEAFEAFRAAAKAAAKADPETVRIRNRLYRERARLSRTERHIKQAKLGKMTGRLIDLDEAMEEIGTVIAGWVQIIRRVPVEVTALVPDACPHCGHVMGLREALRPEIERLIRRVQSQMEAESLKGTTPETPAT